MLCIRTTVRHRAAAAGTAQAFAARGRFMPACILLACAALVCAMPEAAASSCRDPLVQPVRFAKGSSCWRYRGDATGFTGRFSRGQVLTVRMFGELSEYDPATRRVVTRWSAREPLVRGPGDFLAETREPGSGSLTVTLPASGRYEIGFYPCAMWRGRGEVEICATMPGR